VEPLPFKSLPLAAGVPAVNGPDDQFSFPQNTADVAQDAALSDFPGDFPEAGSPGAVDETFSAPAASPPISADSQFMTLAAEVALDERSDWGAERGSMFSRHRFVDNMGRAPVWNEGSSGTGIPMPDTMPMDGMSFDLLGEREAFCTEEIPVVEQETTSDRIRSVVARFPVSESNGIADTIAGREEVMNEGDWCFMSGREDSPWEFFSGDREWENEPARGLRRIVQGLRWGRSGS